MTTTNKKTFLFIICSDETNEKNKALIATLKAFIFSKFSQELEYLGEQAIVFSTKYSSETIEGKIKRYKVPYILIDIGTTYDLSAISAVLPSSQIEMLKKISEDKSNIKIEDLHILREKAVAEEAYEKAAEIRDLINKKKK